MNKERIREITQEELEKPNVMGKYYGIKYNEGVQLVEGITLNRLIGKHGSNGYVVLSACRVANGDEQNTELTKRLLADIRREGYGYLPIYRGYNDMDNGESADYKPSFIVFNYDTDGKPTDFRNLSEFAFAVCGKYKQDSVLIAPPNEPPYYTDENGLSLGRRFSADIQFDNVYINPQPQNLNERQRRKGEAMLVEENGSCRWVLL